MSQQNQSPSQPQLGNHIQDQEAGTQSQKAQSNLTARQHEEADDKREKNLLIGRILFVFIFFTMQVVLTITKNDKKLVLDSKECIRDAPFEWFEDLNEWFVDNNRWKNVAIVQSSVCIDYLMIGYLVIFFFWGTTTRVPTALVMFYPLRNIIQTVFLMGRLKGFLWSWPDVQSLTVPYFDTNDFYYSGHVGNTTIMSMEFLAMRWYKHAAFAIFSVIDVWITLTWLRTHYIIDFTTGYAVGRLVHRWAEKATYYMDVKLLGWPKEKRYSYYFDICGKCGWGSEAVLQVTSQAEVDFQKKLRHALLGGKIQAPTATSKDEKTDEKGIELSNKEDKVVAGLNETEKPMLGQDGGNGETITRQNEESPSKLINRGDSAPAQNPPGEPENEINSNSINRINSGNFNKSGAEV